MIEILNLLKLLENFNQGINNKDFWKKFNEILKSSNENYKQLDTEQLIKLLYITGITKVEDREYNSIGDLFNGVKSLNNLQYSPNDLVLTVIIRSAYIDGMAKELSNIDDNQLNKNDYKFKKYKYYYNPKRINFLNSIIGGKTLAQETISEFKYNNNKQFNFTSQDEKCELIFLNELNKNTYEEYNFYSSGYNTAIYKVEIKDIKNVFPDYKDTPLILRLFIKKNLSENYLDNFLKKYKKDLNNKFMKNHIIDILYYGEIIKDNIEYIYIICPFYDTEPLFNNLLTLSQKKKYLLSCVNFLNDLSNNELITNDFKLANISINCDCEIMIIDYNIDTIAIDENFWIESFHNQDITKSTKLYNICLSEIIYQFFILINSKINIEFTKLFISNEQYKINDSFNKQEYKNIIDNCQFYGIKEILFDDNGYGLINTNENKIPDYNELIKLINLIKKK